MAELPIPRALLVLTTEADAHRAEALARRLLEARLAACISLMPLRSSYHWQGAIETADEVQLLIKTDKRHLAALEELVRQQHSYACPEWLHWPVQASPAYGAWLAAELSRDGTPPGPADPPGGGDPTG